MSKWSRLQRYLNKKATSAEPAIAPMSLDADNEVSPQSSEEGIPDVHTITIRERRLTVDLPTLIQNNVKTDTIALDLDSEWDGISPVIILGPCENAVQLVYGGTPVTIPQSLTAQVGTIDVSVVGYNAEGDQRLVTVAAPGVFEVIQSGCYIGDIPEEDDTFTIISQVLAAGTAASEAANKVDGILEAEYDRNQAEQQRIANENARIAAETLREENSAEALEKATEAKTLADGGGRAGSKGGPGDVECGQRGVLVYFR